MKKFQPSVTLVLRAALGVLFLYAGVQKALHLTNAVLAVHGYAVVPSLLVHPVALGLVLLEIVSGALLLVGLFSRFAAGTVAGLAVLFLAALIQARARGLDISCGCFGGSAAGKGVSWLDFVREPLILAVAVYLARRGGGPWALDRSLIRGRAAEKELKLAGPLLLTAAIVVASVAVPTLTGALDLPRAADPAQVSVSGGKRFAPFPVGSTLPDFSAPALYGGTISWHDYRGVPTVLVIWAPWCPDCREALPLLAQVVGDFPGVRLVSVVTAADDLPGPTPEQFLESHHLTFPTALDSTDERLADVLGVQAFPTVYYVQASGTVSAVTVGERPEAVFRASVQAVAR